MNDKEKEKTLEARPIFWYKRNRYGI